MHDGTCLRVCLYTTWVPAACRGQKRETDPMELELQMVVSHQTRSSGSVVLLISEPSLQPCALCFEMKPFYVALGPPFSVPSVKEYILRLAWEQIPVVFGRLPLKKCAEQAALFSSRGRPCSHLEIDPFSVAPWTGEDRILCT